MKYLKIFDNKTQHENAVLNGTLYSPSISFIINDGENTELVFKIIKVKNCIELGYFGVDSKNIKPIAELPHAVTLISDFADVFFADKDLDGNKLSQPYIFILGENNTLNEEQLCQIIDILNQSVVKRSLEHLNLKNYKLPYKNVVIRRYGNDDYYSYDSAHDFMSGSQFNKVTIINQRGNISSMNSLFRGSNMKELEFIEQGGVFKPTDMAGMMEFCGWLKKFPNTIRYNDCVNIGYAWEYCGSLPEIPSYKSVTNESERLNTIENIMGGENGLTFAEQAFNGCGSLKKIGPVINCKRLYTSNNYTPYLMFDSCNNVSDIRLKNLSNSDWNLSSHLSNIDIDSIKYAIENLTYQADCNWVNKIPNNVSGKTMSYVDSTTSLTFNWPKINKVQNSTKFKINIPSGYIMYIYAYNNSNVYINHYLTVNGNGIEQSVEFTNSNAYYPYFVLKKLNGTNLTPHDTIDLNISISIYKNNAYTENLIVGKNHNLTFGGRFADKISDKSIISSSIIQTANDKGWKIFSDSFEITPTSSQLTVNYRFNFKDWELNTDYENDVIVNDTSITINKFRPNMWIIRSPEAMNSTNLSGKFANLYMNIHGIANHISTIFSYRFYANGAVGGDGGTKGSILGAAILPFSLHSTPTYYYAPELPFSAYVWDGPANETSAWRGDWGCGYNGYGFRDNKTKRLVYPNQTTFPTPYNNYKLAIGLYTGNIHTFDRWWADNDTLKSYLNFQGPYKVTMCGRFRRYSIPKQTITLTSGYTLLSNGQLSENADFSVSDFISVNNVTQVKWKNQGSGLICEYDANKNIIDYWNPNGNPRTVTLTGGNNTKYIRISMKTSEINNVYLTGENTQEFIYKGNNVTDMTVNSSKMLATQEVFENVKFKFSGMLDDDYVKWSHTSSTIKDENGNVITEIIKDGIYTVTNSGLDGGFILYGNNSLTGTNPITIEIIDNPSFIDENGYIDISDKPITIELVYDNIQ